MEQEEREKREQFKNMLLEKIRKLEDLSYAEVVEYKFGYYVPVCELASTTEKSRQTGGPDSTHGVRLRIGKWDTEHFTRSRRNPRARGESSFYDDDYNSVDEEYVIDFVTQDIVFLEIRQGLFAKPGLTPNQVEKYQNELSLSDLSGSGEEKLRRLLKIEKEIWG